MIVIVKKEDKSNCTNYKQIRNFKFKGIKYYLFLIINKIKKNELEIIDDKHI